MLRLVERRPPGDLVLLKSRFLLGDLTWLISYTNVFSAMLLLLGQIILRSRIGL